MFFNLFIWFLAILTVIFIIIPMIIIDKLFPAHPVLHDSCETEIEDQPHV